MTATDSIPPHIEGSPQDVANLVYNIVTNHYAYISGQSFNCVKGEFLR